MGLTFADPVVGGVTLVRPAIQSPGYLPGVRGWAVKDDDSAEFNDVTIRNGSLIVTRADGTILVINDEFIQFLLPDGVTAAGQIAVLSSSNGGLSIAGQHGPLASPLYLLADAAASVVIPGSLVANEPGAVAATPETWHLMTLKNGWAAVAGSVANKYQLVGSPPRNVEIIGSLSGAAATAPIFATLPPSYIPASPQRFGAEGGVAGMAANGIACDAAGNLSVGGAPALPSATSWWYSGLISLDA